MRSWQLVTMNIRKQSTLIWSQMFGIKLQITLESQVRHFFRKPFEKTPAKLRCCTNNIVAVITQWPWHKKTCLKEPRFKSCFQCLQFYFERCYIWVIKAAAMLVEKNLLGLSICLFLIDSYVLHGLLPYTLNWTHFLLGLSTLGYLWIWNHLVSSVTAIWRASKTGRE